eukprot:6490879-Amphidinium_carterae.2
MTLWGASVSDARKDVRGAVDKIKPLVVLTSQLLNACTASSDEVSSLLGHWTFHCMFKRSCLCLLDEVYAWIRRDPSGTRRRQLGAKVRDEFLGLLMLWPLLRTDMNSVPAERCYASDATVTRGAVVESEPISAEWATFFWSRRPQKWEEMVRARPGHQELFEFPMAERRCQDSLLEHVLQAVPLRVAASYKFRRRSHINVQELLAYRTALKVAAGRVECWQRRVPFMIDSQVVTNVISRGRSSSHQLNYVLQTCLGVTLFCGITPMAIWVGTEENPSDDPTRGKALRLAKTLCPEAELGIQELVKKHKWVYLVTKAQWRSRRALWDGSLGFEGEGPTQRALPPENVGRDLRVRVTAPTMKRYAARVNEFRQ